MSFLEPKEICELIDLSTDEEKLLESALNSAQITILPEPLGEKGELLFSSDSGEFTKWMKDNEPSLSIEFDRNKDLIVRRANDIWMPLIKLAENCALPVFLGIVSNYLYNKMKGALKSDTQRVHLSIIYKDKKRLKKFKFEGDVQALKEAIKKVDFNAFADK